MAQAVLVGGGEERLPISRRYPVKVAGAEAQAAFERKHRMTLLYRLRFIRMDALHEIYIRALLDRRSEANQLMANHARTA